MSTTEEETSRVVLTAIEAHRLTTTINFLERLKETASGAQMELNGQIESILERAGVKPDDKPWGMEIDGDNVVIRRQ